MARFYIASPLTVATTVELPQEVVRHLNVVRCRVQQSITLFNGDGNDYVATLLELTKRSGRVAIRSAMPVSNETKLPLTLLMCLIANDKFDWVVQKAVELGVNYLIPVYSQLTQRLSADKIAARLAHWHKVIISASEQCGRARLMQIEAPQPLTSALTNLSATHKFILSPRHSQPILPSTMLSSLALLVGPEGGFLDNEIELAIQAGFMPRQLGPRILRAETAAISGLSCIQMEFGDFG